MSGIPIHEQDRRAPDQYTHLYNRQSALPPIVAVETKHKHCHGFIGAPGLLLRRRRLDTLASAAGEE